MLTFNLEKKWFEKIKSGEKTVEYREVKPYWEKRLNRISRQTKEHNVCKFRLGYTGEVLSALITSIDIVNGNNTDLHIDKVVYAIHFKLIEEVTE